MCASIHNNLCQRLVDSLNFLSMPLSKLNKAFGFPESKGYFPIFFPDGADLSYRGINFIYIYITCLSYRSYLLAFSHVDIITAFIPFNVFSLSYYYYHYFFIFLNCFLQVLIQTLRHMEQGTSPPRSVRPF